MPISDRTQKLLSGGEGIDVEYKTKVTQEFNDVLVAFANGNGGICLLGVEDSEDEKGRQVGKVVGIEINDRIKGQIQSRASQTIDPINVQIEDEIDENGKGIYIVTIPEGQNKPYCTGGGRYLVRLDGQNTAIFPNLMEKYIAPRIQRAPSAKKQLLLEELRDLKYQIQLVMTQVRKYGIPLQKYKKADGLMAGNRLVSFTMYDETLENIIANLTMDNILKIKCSELLEAAKIYIDKRKEVIKALNEKVRNNELKTFHNEDIEKEFIANGADLLRSSMEKLYREISERIDIILS